MRYFPISNEFFKENRKKLAAELTSDSIAVFNANDRYPYSADLYFPFRQNSDLFYLTGIDQEETILVMFPGANTEKHREVLFIRETDEITATWEGSLLTKDQAREISGIQTVYRTDEFEKIFKILANECRYIYLDRNEHPRADNHIATRNDKFLAWCRHHYPLHNYERAAPLLSKLRMIKSDTEISLMQEACRITSETFRHLLKTIKPGICEFEIEAEIYREFLKRRSRGPAYDPIIASGANACVLHYTKNNCECREGEIILMDIGAEYANYASDMTRCVPVSGKFTNRQKEVYNAVLKVMKAAREKLVPGNNIKDYNKEVIYLLEEELVNLGLLNKNQIHLSPDQEQPYRQYFMHGVSHFIGLDTHDVGDTNTPFKEGMVFTCEPGIYIPEEHIGIRLENDILISKDGPVDLMADIPLEADEIEAHMA